MPEWSIWAVSKTVVPLRVPRVRIPVSPLIIHCNLDGYSGFDLFYEWHEPILIYDIDIEVNNTMQGETKSIEN